MYVQKPQKQTCDHCGDPATLIEERKEPHWPFKTTLILSFCYECYQEIKYKKLPKLTDSPYQSRRGNNMQKRRRYFQ